MIRAAVYDRVNPKPSRRLPATVGGRHHDIERSRLFIFVAARDRPETGRCAYPNYFPELRCLPAKKRHPKFAILISFGIADAFCQNSIRLDRFILNSEKVGAPILTADRTQYFSNYRHVLHFFSSLFPAHFL
jgi:hypothetical protein